MANYFGSKTTMYEVGEYVHKYSITESKGLLLMDGRAVSRTTYSKLFEKIATTFGAGDGSTTFNLPNFLGRVPGSAGSGSTSFQFATTDVNITTNNITVSSNESLYTGSSCVITSSGTVPSPLVSGTTYYIIYQSATTIKLATTIANAVAGTAIDITTVGSGTHTLTTSLTSRTIGSILGEEAHAVTVAEMPSHTHDVESVQTASQNAWAGGDVRANSTNRTTTATGGSGKHNNMQPTIFAGYWFIYAG